MAISDNMRAIRKEKGLTQKQVADACGLAVSTFRTYELGNANPKPATVAKLAKALGVSPSLLYGVDWVPGIEIPDQEAASALYQSFLVDKGGALPIENTSKSRLLSIFDRLNESGQKEAVKRMEEMSLAPQYRASQDQSTLAKVLLQYITEKDEASYTVIDESVEQKEIGTNGFTLNLEARHIVMEQFALEKRKQWNFWCYFTGTGSNGLWAEDVPKATDEILSHHLSENDSIQNCVVFFDHIYFENANTILNSPQSTNCWRSRLPKPILYVGIASTGEMSVLSVAEKIDIDSDDEDELPEVDNWPI